ncbi:dynamin family protein [Sphaerospermopsis aphanizomenoides BCCUSP55]|uniref:dynamin family protein n=1 Tax=Sphaerospermopsis aphanizomenoides TaxID=459663 RepID=UPI0019033856|nr:dynamin family protein [Sphaerospermopsis aphanizomenoides]MBK1987638.1 dynamin family protein [Sphaerospermopsis aphanizomenoides BCCUSP55]
MQINRDVLKQVSVKTAAKQTGVGALPRSIHKTPGLREWVTLETVALPPVPVNKAGSWHLISLLVVPTTLSRDTLQWKAPWGAVEWSWSDRQLVQTIDLRQRQDTAVLRRSPTISAYPTAANLTLNTISRTQKENHLFQVLDGILATPPSQEVDLSPLAIHYAHLLPGEIYPYYWALIPESKAWLRPESPLSPLSIPSPIPTPTDLTAQVSHWLHQSLDLAASTELSAVVAEIEKLVTLLHLPGFRVAVVGEFNRGKSTLVNRLLHRSVVPVGIIPTTAVLTSITPGNRDEMQVYFSQQRSQIRPLEPSSWKDLLATNEKKQEREVFAGVQITINEPWLQKLDIELIDTPGTSDLNASRTSLVFNVLDRCDAVVMVVSAIAPFSLTEVAFLKQQVMGRHINQVLVVVSHLDTFAPAERERLFQHICQRVREISAHIPILPLHPMDEDSETVVLEAVRHQIATMVSGSRRAWRSQQVAAQLVDHLSNLIQIGENAIASARLDPVAREKALEQAQTAAKKAESHWRKICREIDHRRNQCNQKLRDKILNAKDDFLDVLTFELSRTPNPKFWWEKEFPFRLRREFPAIGRRSEGFLIKALANDFEWLQREVKTIFNMQMNWKGDSFIVLASPNSGINHSAEIVPTSSDMVDIQKYRLMTRIGSSMAMIGGYIFGGPVGVIANMGIAVLSEGFLNKTLEEQRQIIRTKLTAIIDQAFEEHSQHVSQRLSNLYKQLIDDTKRQQSLWESAKNTAVNEPIIIGETEIIWQQVMASATILQTEINKQLQIHSPAM